MASAASSRLAKQGRVNDASTLSDTDQLADKARAYEENLEASLDGMAGVYPLSQAVRCWTLTTS